MSTSAVPPKPRLEQAVLVALFVGGALAWAALLSSDRGLLSGPAATVEDWPKEFRYAAVLQQAVREHRLPLYVSRPILSGRKLLAVPELNCAPQVLLLAWLPVPVFLEVDALLNYTLGFCGLLLLRRRYALGLGPFSLLALVFFFNGHLVAHLAVGHSMWAAHFLLPFFVLGVLELLEAGQPAPGMDAGRRPLRPVWLALVLFAVLLRGGVHLFAWCVLFLILLAFFNPRRATAVLRTLAWAAALGAVRLLPAAFLARHREQAFVSGFPSLRTLAQALVSIRDAAEPLRGGFFGALAWWEYDTYVGPLVVLWLLVFGLVLVRWPALRDGAERGLWGPMFALAVLSLGDSYLLFNLSPVPLLNAERVSSRLLVLPLVFLATLAALRMETWSRWWRGRGRATAWAPLTLLAWMAAAAGLAAHGAAWRMARLQQIVPARRALMNVELATPPPLVGDDLAYVVVVGASLLVTAGALAAAVWTLRRERRAGC